MRQAALALLLAAGLTGMGEPPKSPPAAPARPGDVAIVEEMEAARVQGTAEAYELFIARHPDHPLAAQARRELERLRAR